MTVLKLGSLFDGIGVFPLAAVHCGMEPVWASEIEARPISITRRHFPDMLHLGDITKISGAEIPPVDVITFGSPCQDLSQIGTRNGFAGKKSSLFYQAMRIIEEMRYATNGRYPAFCIWENVAGAFSSNDRLDFAAMLRAFTGAEVSVPPRGWAHAGIEVVIDGAAGQKQFAYMEPVKLKNPSVTAEGYVINGRAFVDYILHAEDIEKA